MRPDAGPDLLATRQLRALHRVCQAAADARSLDACLDAAAKSLAHSELDLPVLLFYAFEGDADGVRLVAHAGLAPNALADHTRIDGGASAIWPVAEALATGHPVAIDDVQRRAPGLTSRADPEPIERAYLLPIQPSSARAPAFAIAGVSPRLPHDDSYHLFIELLARSLGGLAAGALIRAREQQHAAARTELDLVEARGALAAAAGPRARVLVAGHDTDTRTYLTELLGGFHDVRAVCDGGAALGAAAAAADAPDLIVLDVTLACRDRPELLRELRANERTRSIPVILSCARSDEDAALEGLTSGADDYLVEPFSGKALLARVRSRLALAKLRKESADKLAEANKELEAFSYSVSHDLRAPLRAIDGFSKALLTEYAGKLDDNGRRYLDRVRSASQRMAVLIDDLLSLSRIARAPMKREQVDLSALCRKILAELAARDAERSVEAKVEDGLAAHGDPRLVSVVLENLLDNAWKFTSKKPQAQIEVASEQREGQNVFWIRDDGAGFDMEYAKKLFAPFQRLHSANEFQGTGIGLATVHRVISRHGGKVWVEAALDRGATFFFTLAGPT